MNQPSIPFCRHCGKLTAPLKARSKLLLSESDNRIAVLGLLKAIHNTRLAKLEAEVAATRLTLKART